MQRQSLAQVYVSKTDDELLALAADRNSLTDDAQHLLTLELSKRNLSPNSSEDHRSHETGRIQSERAAIRSRLHWLGLWFLNTLLATIVAPFSAGVTLDMWRPLLSNATKTRLLLTPYYPVPIVFALLAGFLINSRLRKSYRFWVWAIPLLNLLRSIFLWKSINQAPWAAALWHFFGDIPFPTNRDQLDATVYLYLTVAFSLGAWLQTVTGLALPKFARPSERTGV